ncbi:pyruvate carboxyltransferase [Subtercola lobariae]|uniref:Hydroxymethylglutaryl-CoA lyase n=1 Tax=Subtercola lobariae TaxID=1588641 RepID=A0A917BBR6_9MICO|nr:pyruvate carboxyltransferase [Subtercola lobariae]GGF33759.1 hydroxymethylglutaryl-CoA lyase [Subtercola lobariae]
MNSLRIRDISPRLAFQAQPGTTAQKIELVERLIASGVTAVEVSSFVRPDLVPGLADAAEVFAGIQRRPGVSLECCVANATGLTQAIEAGADAAWFLLSVDEGFSSGNTGRSIEKSLAVLEQLQHIAEGSRTQLGSYLIGAWGGPVGLGKNPRALAPVLKRLGEIGVDDWILADSFGYASPRQITETVAFVAPSSRLDSLTVQVHDTRGMGVADVVELARAGVRNIDTSLAGSGGHPASPAARVGGVCTEDAVQALELMGFDTGIDLPALIDAANWLDTVLGGHEKGFVRHVGAVPQAHNDKAPVVPEFSWSR